MKFSTPTIKRLAGYMRPYRGQFILSIITMSLYGATDGVVPYILKRVLDDVFGSQDRQTLNIVVGLILVFAVVRGALGFFQRYIAAAVGLRIVRDIRNDISQKILSMDHSFFQRENSGALISRVTNDTLNVRSAINEGAAAILRDAIRVVALLCVAAYLDPILAAVAFIGFPLGLMPIVKYGKKVRRLSKVSQGQLGGLTSLLQETIVGHAVVRAFTNEKYEHERFKSENQSLTDTGLGAEKYGSLSAPTNEVIASVAVAAVVMYGGLSVIGGVRTEGEFIAFVSAMMLLYEPLKRLSRLNSILQIGFASAERIFEILDAKSDVQESPGAIVLSTKAPLIEYRDIWFSYPARMTNGENVVIDDQEWALKGVSFTISPGETVALVGMSGGGKSTIVNLLPRFYDSQKGMVFINGRNIKDYTIKSLREHIAIVSQHTFLFNDTIYKNIAYGRPGADLNEVVRAAEASHAHHFIMQLPHGYETVIGEQGLKLSGGERARIAMARALLKDAPILILDEATASLDSESEGLVQEAIDRLMYGRTVLVIAHRLATVRNATKIMAVVDGEIVESGSHEELLRLGKEYSKLYRLQFSKDDSAEFASTEFQNVVQLR